MPTPAGNGDPGSWEEDAESRWKSYTEGLDNFGMYGAGGKKNGGPRRAGGPCGPGCGLLFLAGFYLAISIGILSAISPLWK